MPPSYNGSKCTYVTERHADHADWLTDEPNAKIIRDDEIHFGGNWLETLVGIDLDFYGAESQAFMVDGVVFEVLCDPDDGYRSFLGGVLAQSPKGYNFYEKPFATVRLEEVTGNPPEEEDETYPEIVTGRRLVDVDDGHVWLTFGTLWYDEYYPMFIFNYSPKEI